MDSKKSFEELLLSLIHGESSEDSLRQLADLLHEDVDMAGRVRSELEFSELLRQGFRDEKISASSFEKDIESHSLEIDEIVARVVAGKPTTFECDRLAKYLWAHPAAITSLRQQLAEDEWLTQAIVESKDGEAFVEALETRMWAETRQDHFVEDFTARFDEELAQEKEEAGNIIPMPIPWGRTLVKMGSVAAAIAVGAFVLVQQIADRLEQGAIVASVVKSSSDARWSGDVVPGHEGQVKVGRYQLESGVVALKFPSGGEMTVEGPAIFRIDDDESAYVYHGVALAKSSGPGEGIVIKSRDLNISKSAPLIGIDARSEFSTNAIVFEGDGGVCLTDGGGCRNMSKFDSIKADHTRDKLLDIPYNPHAFEKSWELLAGVEANMGPVRIEMPGTPIQLDRGEGEVQVFVENQSFRPDEAVEVDQLASGRFASAESNRGESLQVDGNLRSYLLQVIPDEGSGDKSIEASLTFDHPVVGVIYSADRLDSSDFSVGSSIRDPGGEFSRVRGLDSESDEILLSDDGRTLNLRLHGKSSEVDQIRVLVALR
mgnify:CR=1 FL=1